MIEDFGNIGSLVTYLNGKASIEERILNAKKIFFIPMTIPPQLKEGIVISWLFEIISTNKILVFAEEEILMVWSTLRELLYSKRLQALCSRHWVCPLTKEFTETLVSTFQETTSSSTIRKEISLICKFLLENHQLSPQVHLLTNQSVTLSASILDWLNEEEKETAAPFLSVASLFLKSANSSLKALENIEEFITIYERLLFPMLKMFTKLKENEDNSKDLRLEIERFIMSTVYSFNYKSIYSSILKIESNEESKVKVGRPVESFYSFIIKCLSEQDKEFGAYILREFSVTFFQTYKGCESICFEYIVKILHLMNLTINTEPLISKNSLTTLQILPKQLSKIDKHRFVLAILESSYIAEVDLSQKIKEVSLQSWLTDLGSSLLQNTAINENVLKSLTLILKMNPFSVKCFEKLFYHILSYERISEESYNTVNELMCEILNIHIKLRTVNIMYENLSRDLLVIHRHSLEREMDFKIHWLTCSEHQMIPPRFLKKLLSSIKDMGAQIVMNFWTSIHNILSQSCIQALDSREKGAIESAGLTIWLASCCLSATPVLEIVSVTAVSDKVFEMMNEFAEKSILPLITASLDLEDKGGNISYLCQSLLYLLLMWSELHIHLVRIDERYMTVSKYPISSLWADVVESTDFSALIPFVKGEVWAQLSSLSEENEDVTRFLLTQLLIQKITSLRVQKFERDDVSGEAVDTSVDDGLQYIFMVQDAEEFPLTTDIIALHLPSLIPMLKKGHYQTLAEYFVNGIECKREAWIKFAKSFAFQECSSLHASCVSVVASKLLSLLNGGKRKFNEQEENAEEFKSFRGLLKTLSKFQEKFGADDQSMTEIKCCFNHIDRMLKSKAMHKRLQKRSVKRLMVLLKVLGMFPLEFLPVELQKATFALAYSVLLEEGASTGRKEMISACCSILKRIVSSRHSTWVTSLSVPNPHNMLYWVVKECESFMNSYSLEDSHIQMVVGSGLVHHSKTADDAFTNFLHLITLWTELYVKENSIKHFVSNYAQHVTKSRKAEQNLRASHLAATLLSSQIQKAFGKYENGNVPLDHIKALNNIGPWILETAQSLDLAKVNSLTLLGCLTLFSAVLELHNKILKRKGTANSQGYSVDLKLNIDSIISNGVKLADLTMESDSPELKKLGFSIYHQAFRCGRSNDEGDEVADYQMFKKAWKAMHDTGMNCPENASIVSLLYRKELSRLVASLNKDLAAVPRDENKLSQCYTVVVSNAPSVVIDKFLEELVSVLCVDISGSSTHSADVVALMLKIFLAVLESKYGGLELPVKLKLLSVCTRLNLSSVPTHKFKQVFMSVARMLMIFATKDTFFSSSRISSLLSVVVYLVEAVMDVGDRGDAISNQDLNDLEKCCSEMEKVIQCLRNHATDLNKVSVYGIGKIIEKLVVKTRIHPSIKASVERIALNLFDSSDVTRLQHLMVVSPNSVKVLLKNLHSTYNSTFRYDPRKD